jgi:hypothetical protein
MAFLYMRGVLEHVETQDELRWRKMTISRTFFRVDTFLSAHCRLKTKTNVVHEGPSETNKNQEVSRVISAEQVVILAKVVAKDRERRDYKRKSAEPGE